jgi:oligosaccharide repeat unit polymerase
MQPAISTKPHGLELTASLSGTTRFPLLGIVATILGTFGAVNLIPEDPRSEGALFFSALALSVGLAAAPLAAALRDPKSLLCGEHLLALAPIYWLLLEPLQGAYALETVQPEQISQAFIGIGLFVVAVWLTAYGRPWKVPDLVVKSVSQDFSPNTYFILSVASFVLGMLPFAIPCNFNVVEMVSYLGADRWSAPWVRGQLGGWDAFLDHLQYFGYLAPTLTVIIARRAGWVNLQTLLSGGMAIIVAAFLAQSGSRRIIGVVFGMSLILWLLSQQRVRTRQLLVSAAAAIVLLVGMQVMLEYRLVGLGRGFEGEHGDPAFQRGYLHVDDNFYALCQTIKFIPESYPYVYHKYLVWVLIRPVPRVFWPDKPLDPGFDLSTALGLKGVSLTTSVIGELYMSAGLIGIALGGWLYGRLAGMASQLLTRGATFGAFVIYSTLMMALFSGMRSTLELVLVSYVVLAWAGLSRVIIYFKGKSVS